MHSNKRPNPEQTGKKHVPPQFLCSEPRQTPGNGKSKVLRKPGFLIRLPELRQCNSPMLARVSWGHHGHVSLGLLHGPPLTRGDMQHRFGGLATGPEQTPYLFCPAIRSTQGPHMGNPDCHSLSFTTRKTELTAAAMCH